MKCENCGTTLCGGLCPYCQEESLIYLNQTDDLPEDFEFSEEFGKKVTEQLRELHEKNIKIYQTN